MQDDHVDWAGVPFLPVFHHDAHFFRRPGLFAFVHRGGDDRVLLLVGHSDNIAVSVEGHPLWGEALRLGFNELNVCTRARDRLDRRILTAHIIKRCSPLLSVLEQQARPYAPLAEQRRREADGPRPLRAARVA